MEVLRAVVGQRHQLAALVEVDVFAVNPATLPSPPNVTPGVIVEAALDVESLAFGNYSYAGEVGIWAGAQIDFSCGIAWLGGVCRSCAEGRHQRGDGQYASYSHSCHCSWGGSCSVGGARAVNALANAVRTLWRTYVQILL